MQRAPHAAKAGRPERNVGLIFRSEKLAHRVNDVLRIQWIPYKLSMAMEIAAPASRACWRDCCDDPFWAAARCSDLERALQIGLNEKMIVPGGKPVLVLSAVSAALEFGILGSPCNPGNHSRGFQPARQISL